MTSDCSNNETRAVMAVLENRRYYGDHWAILAAHDLREARRSWWRAIWYGSARRAAFYRLMGRLLMQVGDGTPLIALEMFRPLLAERMRRVNWTEIVDRLLDRAELAEEHCRRENND